MGSQPQPQWVVPNPQVPRTFGLLNIIFGVLLLLVGAAFAAWLVLAPTFTKAMQRQIEQQQATQKAEREARIADLKRQEAAATSETEKLELKTTRETIESTPEPDVSAMADFTGWNIMSDRRLAIYYFSEVGAGILLNLLMIIAGGGLMALAEWGRRLAIGVAWLKILRWVAMTIVSLVLVLPLTMERMDKAFTKMDAQIQARPGAAASPFRMADMARWTAIWGAVVGVFSAVASSIYPALTLWYLTRPRARAACLAVAAKPESPEQPMEWS